jgi:dolichyl-phosphate-mannose-protein mannosyltransferase
MQSVAYPASYPTASLALAQAERAGSQHRWRSNIVLVAACIGLLAVALAFRLPRLDVPNDNYDEGVYLESLLLMHHGYRPFRDIVATQGPLHLYLAYPSYALGGYTLAAARLGTVDASLLGVLGVGVAAGVLFGRVAGFGAALVLALSPTYLSVSRQALPEPLAIGMAAVSVACAVLAQRTGDTRWRVLAGALLGLACLVKPIVGVALLPVVSLSGDGRSLRTASIAPIVAALVGITGLFAVGVGSSVDQVVGWRLAAGQLGLETVLHNAALLVDKMYLQEHPAVYALAAIGASVLWKRDGRLFVGIAGWLVGALIVLLAYTELSGHLGTLLLVPLALLMGAATQAVLGAVRSSPWWKGLMLALPLAAWVLVGIPSIVHDDYQIAAGLTRADRNGPEDNLRAAQIIAEATDPDDVLLTDSPYLAFLANRLVSPSLVDPSSARIRAGAVTSDELIGRLDADDADVVVLWTGKLAHLDGFFATIVDRYTPVASFGTIDKGTPRAIYVRQDDAPDANDPDTVLPRDQW